jgi:hypothetical protein
MTSRLRRAVGALGVATAALTATVAVAPAASADPDIPLDWTVDATTHIAGLNQDVAITGGTFVGTADLGTGEIVADLTLPAATTQVKLIGLPLANTAFQVAPTGPATGTIDLATLTVTMTSTFHIEIPT